MLRVETYTKFGVISNTHKETHARLGSQRDQGKLLKSMKGVKASSTSGLGSSFLLIMPVIYRKYINKLN